MAEENKDDDKSAELTEGDWWSISVCSAVGGGAGFYFGGWIGAIIGGAIAWAITHYGLDIPEKTKKWKEIQEGKKNKSEPAASTSSASVGQELVDLKKALDIGAISEAEFQEQKKKIMGN